MGYNRVSRGAIPRCTFSGDIVLRGPLANQGWSADLGDRTHMLQAASTEPYPVVTYAAYALNVIHQHLQLGVATVLGISTCPVVPGGAPTFAAPAALAIQPPYIAVLQVFQPCTIMSFESDNMQMRSYHMAVGNIAGGIASLRRMAMFQNVPVPWTGLTITDFLDATTVPAVFGTVRDMMGGKRPNVSDDSSKGAKRPGNV